MSAESAIVINNILAVIAVIFILLSIIKKNKYLAIFFSCSTACLILFAQVLIKLPRTSTSGWLVWIIILILFIFGFINLLKGLRKKK